MARCVRLYEIDHWTRPWCLHCACTVCCCLYRRNQNGSGLCLVEKNTFVPLASKMGVLASL